MSGFVRQMRVCGHYHVFWKGMIMIGRAFAVMLVAVCILLAAAPQDAKADMSGTWVVDINWVPLFIDASFQYTLRTVVPESFYTTDLGSSNGWAFESSPMVLIQGNTDFPGLLYVGLNYQGLDEAVGGWQQNTDVPNWGSHHQTRGTLASGAGDSAAATGGE